MGYQAQELTIKFQNVSADKAEKFAGELEERLRCAHEEIQVERRKDDPHAQGLGENLIIEFLQLFAEHLSQENLTLIEQAIIITLIEFLREKGVDIELSIEGKILQLKSASKDILQQLKDFIRQNRKKNPKSD
jgi:hypothetical protein